jgi:hypothetical protein
MTDNPLWERQPTDTDKSFEAFCIYRDMGASRSLRDVARKLDKSLTIIGRWSTDHNWQERISKYQEYRNAVTATVKQEIRAEIEADAIGDYQVIRKAIQKRVEALQSIDYRSNVSDLHDLISLMEHANSYARLNTGLPEKITESKNTNDNRVSGSVTLLSELSDDDLDSIINS